ncbi:hypothetical protein DPMN_013604 [Dreissena polymorpha]|uniref:Uncharacterized protein n=1 Tax=Dreissena polymorpha TaxID=45954 RepID=A0A9D4NA50_DREPO|nr:hypothetical protein DPMN_013601 [Dreissena polymorpha]KAH3889545.1 hypothetical protein DPMN_013604 [Dreissena polymorpha]
MKLVRELVFQINYNKVEGPYQELTFFGPVVLSFKKLYFKKLTTFNQPPVSNLWKSQQSDAAYKQEHQNEFVHVCRAVILNQNE